MASAPAASALANSVAETIDAAAAGRVIVVGSLPPSGRDLDVVARSAERVRIESALAAAGLVRKGGHFALFRDGCAYGVELFPAEHFAPQAALDELFAQALALSGSSSLARPAPAHALIILARLVVEEGALSPKRSARLERILSEDPQAWRHARQVAPAWQATRALTVLERAAQGGPLALRKRLKPGRLRARVLPRRGLLVALSGIDGSGKSSQARALADALSALDVGVEVVWNDLLGNRTLHALVALPKALLRRAGLGREGMARYEETPARSDSAAAGAFRGIWSTVMTFANSLEQRALATRAVARGRVVVFDRSPLDLAVRMEVLYRSNVRLQRRLVRLAGPRPDLAFLLDIPPELSLARKDDVWSPSQLVEQAALYRELAPSFGVRPLDGQRPAQEIAAEIAREAWLALR